MKPAPPRLGVDGHGLHFLRTGVGNYIASLVEAMGALLPPDALAVYLYGEPGEALPFGTVRVPRTPLWTTVRLPLHFAVHGRPRVMLYPGQSMPAFGGGRSVATVHDLAFELFPGHFGRADRARLRAVTRNAVRRADLLVAVSRATRDDLVSLYGVDPARVRVVHHGVDPRFRPPPPEETAAVRRRHGLDRPYVLTVGTLQSRKNHAALIRALPLLHAAGVDVDLAVAGGPGWLYDETLRLVDGLGLRGRVRFLGYVPDADLPGLYAGAAAAAVVSLYEGFGMPVLEGMACGAPTLVSNVSSLPEVGGDAVVTAAPGRVDEIAHALQRLICDGSLRAELCARMPAQVARFSWREAAALTLNAMNEVA